jgi:Icc protein
MTDKNKPRLTAGHDRRAFLRTALGASAALAGFGLLRAEPATPRQRVLRLAHLTDVHVQPERKADQGMAACLRHVQEQKPKPDIILFGGDCVMDAFAAKRDRTQLQWELWKSVLKHENGLPIYNCLGNHDIWGWDKKKSEATGREADYGKRWGIDALAMPKRFYRFTKAGWHFIALDGVQPSVPPGKYAAYLDEEQLAWLKRELAAIPASEPILIWSHIPLVAATPLLEKRKSPHETLEVSPGWIHSDAGMIADLLAGFPNVKACLSGHLHQVDHVRVKGINYHCNGAVSGNWWKGLHDGFPEGYALLDLYSDGGYDCAYHAYGWQAVGDDGS